MKQLLSLSLIVALSSPLITTVKPLLALDNPNSDEIILAQRGGGGNRGSGNRGGNRQASGNRSRSGNGIKRQSVGANGSGRIKKDRSNSASRPQGNINRDRINNVDRDKVSNRINNIDRDKVSNRVNNIDRDKVNNRINNIDRDKVNNRINNSRDINLDNDRLNSNRINRNIVNTGNRNIVVNPRGWNSWGWNGGSIWRPNYSYWGGGFWGGFAAGAVTTGITAAIVNAANDEPEYIIIQQGTPGYTMFDSYGLTQVRCVENGNLVYIYGPQNSLICANPNTMVVSGYYDVEPETLTLIAR